MPVPRVKVIVNPAAGARSTLRKWPRISRLLKHVGLTFDYQYTEGVGHAIELAREATGDGYRYLVAVGGDGTVHEVANGILHTAGPDDVALGLISTGTGSDFARSTGIPRHYINACSTLTNWRQSTVDIGVVEHKSQGQSQRRFFINAAGIGFDAAAAKATERWPKRLGGTVPYLAGLLQALIGYRNKSAVLNIGERRQTGRVLSVMVANGSYLGGGMHIAPEASLNDSLLDVVVIGDIGKFDLLKSIPMIYKGTHGQHPKVSMHKAATVAVETSEPVLVHADGELLGEGPASFSVKPAALSIVS
jgi:YegS/Rv2252/BmrU family lipid kinase